MMPPGKSNTSSTGAGAVYVLTRANATWSPFAYVKASNTPPMRIGSGPVPDFGRSVALSAERLVVGSPGESSKATGINGDQADVSAAGAGAAYVFF